MKEKTLTAAEELWERAKLIFLRTLHNEDEKSQSERYLSQIIKVEEQDDLFTFFTANDFAKDFLSQQYGDNLKLCLSLAGAKNGTEISFKTEKREIRPVLPAPVLPRPAAPAAVEKVNTFISTMPLDERYTFDEFVIGTSNSWAHAAAMSVAQHPGEAGYNPLFIHGGTGLGKTHLMQAIGNEVRKTNPSLDVCYLTAETFLNEYQNHLQNGQIQSFRYRYRKIDVFLIDDVQFFQKKQQVQEEFFNTFNTLIGAHKQIVMTSDVAPKDLPALEERLISRFEGGMIQGIESPTYETRLAILHKKTEGIHPPIPDFAIKFIADNIKSHVRAIEGALAKIKIMLIQNKGIILTNEMLSRLLRDLIEKEQTIRKLSIEEIQSVVAKKYKVTIAQILSSERTQSLVTPRQLAMYIARKHTTKSLQEIATCFDKKHATILHGVKTIEKRLDVENDLRLILDEIKSEFGLKSTDGMS
jgi:chromosomal replication initiator protein